jgi:hypothetical protein
MADDKGVGKVRHWRFQQDSAGEIARRIQRAIDAGTFAFLTVIPYEKDGLPALRMRVDTVDPSAEATKDADVNDSWTCPPFHC